MAKFVDKDPFVYEQEKTGFLQGLQQFHSARGFPFRRRPTISAKELDLYLLYLKVTGLGGFQKVTESGQWEDILDCFELPRNCSHAANALRQYYIKYLEQYEKIHFLGEDEDDRGDQSGTRPSTPVSSFRADSSNRYRVPSMFCSDKPNISEYDKLQYSLQSGLPNEIDFAINVCTLLSNEGCHILHLRKAPQLIDLLLAHTGVFFEGPGSMRMLYEEGWKINVDRDFVKFWYDTVDDDEVKEIIGPESFKPEDTRRFKDPQLFCQRKLGLSDIEGQRILQIAIILRNLSFELSNKPIMAAHRTLYRFLLLCIHNSCSMLRQIGMDTLSNLADEFVLDSVAYRSTQLMFHTIYKGLEDDDRFVVLRSLEVVEKLLDVENNVDVLEQCLEPKVYDTVIRLLHIHDIQLLLEALELLLVMSENGSSFCSFICKVNRSIDILVCLVTLDAQSLGADAFVGIKIIDPNPEGIHQPHSSGGVSRPGFHHAATPPPPAPTPHHPHQVTPGSKSPGRGGVTNPTVVPPSPSTPPTPNMTVTSKEAEAERFACQWLNCHVVSNTEQSIARVELYAEYLSACKQAKGNVLSSNNFARCVRLTYPHVGMKKVDFKGSMQYHHAGICRRKQPLPFKWQPQPTTGNAVLNSNARPASTMMAKLASRHSPSPNISPSPPPVRNSSFHQNSSPLPNPRAPPPPYHHQDHAQGYHQNFPHSSPQVHNGPISRTGYPPGQHIPQKTGPNSTSGIPPYTAPSHQFNVQHNEQVRRGLPVQQGVPVQQGGTPSSSTQHQQQSFQYPHSQNNRTPVASSSGMIPRVQTDGTHSLPQQHVPQNIQTSRHYNVQLGGPNVVQSSGLPQTSMASPAPPQASMQSGGPGGVPFSVAHNVLVNQLQKPLQRNIVLQRDPNSESFPSQQRGEDGRFTSSLPREDSSTPVPVSAASSGSQLPAQTPPSIATSGAIVHPNATDVSKEVPVAPSTSSASHVPTCGDGAPQPPIQPPSNPMVDALSPTGRSTPCQPSSPGSTRSQADSEPVSSTTEGGGGGGGGGTDQPSAVDLMDGEVRIQKVPNTHLDEKENAAKQDVNQDPAVTTSVSASQEVKSGTSNPETSKPLAPPAPVPTVQQAVCSNKITVSATPHQQQSIALVHTNQVVRRQVVPGGSTIQNVLVPQQSIVLNVQPVVPGQVQITTPSINLQTKPRQPVNIQPKPIQPKPPNFIQQSGQQPRPQTSLPQTSVSIHIPSTQAISIQPNTTFVHQGPPMMTLQHHVQPQIVLGSASFVVRQPPPAALVNQSNQQQIVQSNSGNQQFVANIQNQVNRFPQGSTMVVTSSTPQQTGSTLQLGSQQQPSKNPIVGFGCNTGTQNLANDSPLIKKLLQQGSPLSPPRQGTPQGQAPTPQMQLVQSQGQLVAVNAWTQSPHPQQLPKQGGLVSIAPRPIQGQQQLQQHHHHQQYNPQLMVSLPHPNQSLVAQQLPFGSVQYNQDNVCTPSSDLASPTSSTSSMSKSKKKKSSKEKHRSPKKKKSKKHSKHSSHSPSGSRDSNPESLVSETVSEANPSEHSQDSLDHPIVVPQTPDINNPLKPHFSQNLSLEVGGVDKEGQGLVCNGAASTIAETPKKSAPAKKTTKSKNTKQTKSDAAAANKVFNGVGEEDMIPVEAKIERIENPNHVDYQHRNKERDHTTEGAVSKSNASQERHSATKEQPSSKDVSLDNEASGKTSESQENDVDGSNCVSHNSVTETLDEKSKFNLNEKELRDPIEVKEAMNHFINGQMTDDFIQTEITAALEGKMKKEIAKSLRRSIENDRKSILISDDDSLLESVDNVKKQKCDTTFNSLHAKEDVTVKKTVINGPRNVLENGITGLGQEKSFLSNGIMEENSVNKRKTNPDQILAVTTTSNGHPEISTDILSPNTSVSSSPIGSPICSEQVRSTAPHIPQGQIQLPPSPATTCPDVVLGVQEQRGVKRTADEINRCDTPSSLGSGAMSPPPPVPVVESKKSGSKKRRTSSSSSSSSRRERRSSGKNSDRSKGSHPTVNVLSSIYVCEWSSCNKTLTSAKALHVHACKEHVITASYRGLCEWEGCDNIKRQRWSTVTHIQEKHCSEEALLMAAERRTQKSLEGNSNSRDPSLPLHPVVYNAHTAYHAIRRSLQAPSVHDFMGDREGPVTRSIRITASLILKNIAKYSEEGRSLIQRHEDRLSHVALSKAESAVTIAKCLWFIHVEEAR